MQELMIPLPPPDGTSLTPMVIALVFILMDVAVGMCKGVATKTFSSQRMKKGLWSKAAEVAVIGCAYALQIASAYVDLGFQVPLGAPTAVYVIIMEAASIVESAIEVNPQLRGGVGRIFKSVTDAAVSEHNGVGDSKQALGYESPRDEQGSQK